MSTSMRTHLATLLRQYHQGLYTRNDLYHLIAELYVTPEA